MAIFGERLHNPGVMRKSHTLLLYAALLLGLLLPSGSEVHAQSRLRMNQLGYIPNSSKVAVLISRDKVQVKQANVIDAYTGEVVLQLEDPMIRESLPMGPFATTSRLDFSSLKKEGAYRLEVLLLKKDPEGGSPSQETLSSQIFPIGGWVYDGTADFLLRYMRAQRCGWNPVLKDSCHTRDAIITGHPVKEGQRLDARGGWHDASDCLQYVATTATAVYMMASAFKENPSSFADNCSADGTPVSNGIPDVVDEIYWGLDWLDRLNPSPGEMYNQVADDRDHVGMRLPKDDKADYGWGEGKERPVYYCSGEPGQKGRGLNETTGIASTAGKFSSAFSIGSEVLSPYYPQFSKKIRAKAIGAYSSGKEKPGVCQTVSVRSPYIYEECNWVDDMELAAASLFSLTGDGTYLKEAVRWGREEKVTPWMGGYTAKHYQWYPFVNMGHYLLASEGGSDSPEFTGYLKEGLQRVYERGKGTAFLNGVPSIWCSNNLTAALLSQCICYRHMTGDESFLEMEGALRDWLLGCNPWGVSMVVELPKGGVYPTQPHSFMTTLGIGNTTGGLVDGPVYQNIFSALLGVSTEGGINYEEFQPGYAVYHDSMHDYSTNEPTMDGTATLVFPFSAYQAEGHSQVGKPDKNVYSEGGIIRSDPSKKRISLVFTAADKADGTDTILGTLSEFGVKGAFFCTGEFLDRFPDIARRIVSEGHYLGSHSDAHLLYCPWENRDSLLVTREQFERDITESYRKLSRFGVTRDTSPYFLPPYEWYNSTIASWARSMGLQTVNFTPGTRTNADYTLPSSGNYLSSESIIKSVSDYEKVNSLNGNIMLIHMGTGEERTDKFYNHLGDLIRTLREKGYEVVPLGEAISLQ